MSKHTPASTHAHSTYLTPPPTPHASPPPHTGGGPSHECLVTLVVKLDMGGWLSPKGWLPRAVPPLAGLLQRTWLVP